MGKQQTLCVACINKNLLLMESDWETNYLQQEIILGHKKV
jgi:hypothetical protein